MLKNLLAFACLTLSITSMSSKAETIRYYDSGSVSPSAKLSNITAENIGSRKSSTATGEISLSLEKFDASLGNLDSVKVNISTRTSDGFTRLEISDEYSGSYESKPPQNRSSVSGSMAFSSRIYFEGEKLDDLTVQFGQNMGCTSVLKEIGNHWEDSCSDYSDFPVYSDSLQISEWDDIAAFIATEWDKDISFTIDAINKLTMLTCTATMSEPGYKDDQTCAGSNSTSRWTSVSVEYEYSVVPLPAAAWLFGSAMLGLMGVARRKKA